MPGRGLEKPVSLAVLVVVPGFVLLLLASGLVGLPGFRGGTGPIPAWEYQGLLGVGVNVDWLKYRWVNRYYFYWRSMGVNIPLFFREKGFTNVRIRVGWDVVGNKTVLSMLRSIVDDCLRAGLIPVIAYTARDLRDNPTSREVQERFVEWWLTVAREFRGYPYTVSYDLIVESSGRLKDHPGILNRLYSRVIAGIRTLDPYRVVIVTPPGRSSPFRLGELSIANDGYVLAEWHIYAGGPRSCTYNKTYIVEAVEAALRWSRATGIPTWMGAWRPNEYPRACGRPCVPLCPRGVELEFSKTMTSVLREAGIPYDVNSDTKFFDIASLKWYGWGEETLEVVLGPRN